MPTGEVIARIMAGWLAVFERLMGEWVNIENVSAGDNNSYLNISMYECGNDLVEYWEDLFHAIVRLMAHVVGWFG